MNPKYIVATLAWSIAAVPATAQFELNPPISLSSGAGPSLKALHGDYDGDGNLDLLQQTGPGAGITLFRGDGQGRFVQGADLARHAGIIREAVQADLDGDGHLDVVVVSRDSLQGPWAIWLLKGVQGGTFDVQSTGIEAPDLESIVLADLNGDGNLDLVGKERYSSSAARILYYPGLQSGSFDGTVRVASPQRVRSFRLSDVNVDSHLDLIIADAAGLPPRILLGQGQGLFGPPARFVAGGQVIFKVAALGDFDHDGDDDLLASVSGGGVTLHLNDGAGIFGLPSTLSSDATGVSWTGDLDGDSLSDIVLHWEPFILGPSRFEAFLQSALGGFTQVSLPSGWDMIGTLAVDIDGDGKDDVVGSSYERYLAWQMNELLPAQGYLGAPQDLARRLRGSTELATADLDGDGDRDILLLGADRQTVAWVETVAPRIMAPARVLLKAPTPIAQMEPVDMDRDGHVDLALAMRSTVGGPVHAVAIWMNSGPANFTQVPAVTPVLGASFKRLESHDLDADGDMGLILYSVGSTWGYAMAEVLSNTIAGAPLLHTLAVPESLRAASVAAGEVDGDRLLDLVVQRLTPGTASAKVLLLPGHGGGQFGPPSLLWNDSPAYQISITDYDGDGRDDFIESRPAGGIEWRRRTASGIFASLDTLVAPRPNVSLFQFHAVDFDSDGDVDLVAGGTSSTPLFVAKQLTPGVSSDAFAVSQDRISFPFSFIDLGGDGDMDIVRLDAPGTTVLAHENRGVVAMGTVFCEDPLAANRGRVTALGSSSVVENRLSLRGSGMIAGTFAIVVASRTDGQVTAPAGAPNSLCLTGAVGRFNRADQILSTQDSGLVVFPIDLGSIAQPGGTVAGVAGESWSFQIWYRSSPLSPNPTNFTSGVRVELR